MAGDDLVLGYRRVHPSSGQYSGRENSGKEKDSCDLLVEQTIYHSEVASDSWFEKYEGV